MFRRLLFSLMIAILFAIIFTSCEPMEGSFDSIVEKLRDGRSPANTIVTYTVTFDSMGGTPVQTQTVQEGKPAIQPADPTMDGHIFYNWYSDIDLNEMYLFDIGVTSDIILYAEWVDSNVAVYTVYFYSDGGSSVGSQNVIDGDLVIEPEDPSRRGHEFEYWYHIDNPGTGYDFLDTVTGDMTLFAKWDKVTNVYNVAGTSLIAQFAWLDLNALDNTTYNVQASDSETLTARTPLSYNENNVTLTGITINLTGTNSAHTAILDGKGSLFTVSSGVTLALNNITLRGGSNNSALVTVNPGGALIMNTGSKITGNTTSNCAGGVAVNSNGSLTMNNGATISENIANDSGGGVVVSGGGSFIMNDGTIAHNTANLNGGGGVILTTYGSSFTMSGGTISYNTARDGGGVCVFGNASFTMSGSAKISSNNASTGGGVSVGGATFNMSNGTISGNKANDSGGGVYVGGGSNFNMSGGTIGGTNTAVNGGGVYIESGTFNMSNGKITGNSATGGGCGGGVYINSYGNLYMRNAASISGNTASAAGGGVHMHYYATFNMSNGTISSNIAASTSGGGVHVGRNATFNMEDGIIWGNVAATNGGGVVIDGSFRMYNGTIYGSTGQPPEYHNMASGKGNALHKYDVGTATYWSGSKWVNHIATKDWTFSVRDGVCTDVRP